MQNLEEQKEIFLKEFENLLLKNEICEKTLQLASEKCGLDSNYHRLLFQGGITELLSFLSQSYDKLMLLELSKISSPDRITKKVEIATKTRIRLMNRIILQKISSFYANPLYIKDAIKLCFNSCNTIWQYAGDKSTDYNYYTKRALLISVYLPSLIHYLGDESNDFSATDEFISSSLEKIVRIGKIKNQIKLPKIEDIPILRVLSTYF